MAYNTLIVLIGTSLLGAVSGLVGSFTVLRRRALIGDALAHAALPGLCIAYIIVQRRSLPALLFGALISGIIGVFIVASLRRATRVKEDAAIGIVLSVFYGAGIVLTTIIQKTAGGNSAGLDRFILGATASMIREDVYFIAAVAAFCGVMVLLLYKEFKVIAFDPEFAEAQGWPVLMIDLGLMMMVALTVVIGLPAVGAILMAALMIIPAAAARFWTNRLSIMLVLAGIFGLATGAIGTYLTATFARLPAGPSIVLVSSAIFVFSLLIAPRRGVIAQWIRLRSFRLRVIDQRLAAELAEANGRSTRQALMDQRSWTLPQLQKSIGRMQSDGFVSITGNDVVLTSDGTAYADKVVRATRLWKLFLLEHPQLASSFTDLDAEEIDETLPPEIIAELEPKLAAAGGSDGR
ncbi:MAG: iron chelate uptake ABC transporter family permease subunit [Planctomycetaceae bacterium]